MRGTSLFNRQHHGLRPQSTPFSELRSGCRWYGKDGWGRAMVVACSVERRWACNALPYSSSFFSCCSMQQTRRVLSTSSPLLHLRRPHRSSSSSSFSQMCCSSSTAAVACRIHSGQRPSSPSPSTSDDRHQQQQQQQLVAFVKRSMEQLQLVEGSAATVNRNKSIPLKQLAAVLMDSDEDMFEALIMAGNGSGLRGFLTSHPQDFVLIESRSSRPPPLLGTATTAAATPSSPSSWSVSLNTNPSVPKAIRSPPPPNKKVDVSSTARYWSSFDVKPLLKCIPTTWVLWEVLQPALPAEWLLSIPKEQRKKNIAAALRPYCEIALQLSKRDFAVRLKRDVAADKELSDPLGALVLLHGHHFDESVVVRIAEYFGRSAPYTAFTTEAFQAAIPPQLFDALCDLVDDPSQWRKVIRQFPTLLLQVRDNSVPHWYSLMTPPIHVAAPHTTDAEKRQWHEARAVAQAMRDAVQQHLASRQDNSVNQNALTVEAVLAIAESASASSAVVGPSSSSFRERLERVGGIAYLLVNHADVLPLDESGFVDIFIGVPPTSDELKRLAVKQATSCKSSVRFHQTTFVYPSVWLTRRAAMTSCCGKPPSDLYTAASDAEMSQYCLIERNRWTNKVRTAKKKARKELLQNDLMGHHGTSSTGDAAVPQQVSVERECTYATSQRAIAEHIHAILPKQTSNRADGGDHHDNNDDSQSLFISLSDIAGRMHPDARLHMKKTSVLMFADQFPDLFELAETFHKRSADYFIRARSPGEDWQSQGSGIGVGTFSKEELKSFVMHTMPAAPARSTVTNMWAKLPLSVRKQFRSMTLFRQWLLCEADDLLTIDAFDMATLVPFRETTNTPENDEDK